MLGVETSHNQFESALGGNCSVIKPRSTSILLHKVDSKVQKALTYNNFPLLGAKTLRKLIVGNWKMNGIKSDLAEIAEIAQNSRLTPNVDTAICLPATLIGPAVEFVKGYDFGGQDCHMAESGAHTGCVSAAMLSDAGATLTLVGHSERRANQNESDADINAKAIAANMQGLKVIVCVGETEGQRDAGQAEAVVLAQLAGSIPDIAEARWLSIAYEPVWAIGTGRVPSIADVAQMHLAIREHLLARFGDAATAIRILYGGSMNAENASELLAIPNVDGGLIGGASLKTAKFQPILEAAAVAGV
jgi:triosephosphate isomerase (TIM)